jgi:hypothetical protein
VLSNDVSDTHNFGFTGARLRDGALWQRLQTFEIGGESTPFSFIDRLAKENRWSREHACAAVQEYKRFCYLQRLSRSGLTPSHAVDQVWHLHLLYTKNYWQQFCPEILQAELHHLPSSGLAQELNRFREQYAQTLAQYEAEFGPPPEAIWPDLRQQFSGNDDWRGRKNKVFAMIWQRSMRRLLRPLRAGATAVLFGLLAMLGASDLAANPLNYSGGDFLVLYLQLLFVAVLLMMILRQLLNVGPAPSGALQPEEIAILSGGPARMMDALEVRLQAEGMLAYDQNSHALRRTSSAISGQDRALAEQLMEARNGPDAKALSALNAKYTQPRH